MTVFVPSSMSLINASSMSIEGMSEARGLSGQRAIHVFLGDSHVTYDLAVLAKIHRGRLAVTIMMEYEVAPKYLILSRTDPLK